MFKKDGRVLFNDGWKFTLFEKAVTVSEAIKSDDWKSVDVPHDWLIGDSRNLYKSGQGWYKKTFSCTPDDMNKSVELYFDGVYMNSEVFVNGEKVMDWKNGYTPFHAEIGDFLKEGDNVVHVSVLHESPNSRWYSGAGLYRNVWLIKQNKAHILSDGVYIHTDVSGDVKVDADYVGEADGVRSVVVGESGLTVKNPKLWSPEFPCLYTLKTELVKNGEVIDTVFNSFGFRKIEFNKDNGFVLNGEKLKLHGVCQHHDLGSLGAAFDKDAARRQLDILKEMGVNAIRTAHNPPAAEFLELCDEMGFLVIDEFSDVWELCKTKFDYARFFPDWYKKDVESWVSRDRNHPCVVMWSIGNEIYDTHASERGLEVAQDLHREVTRHDPCGNAGVTIGSNFMMSENARKVSSFLELAGYNYGEQYYDEHREIHPEYFIYGSETTSAVRSRGIYHFPIDTPLLTNEDNQCSDLGNSVVGWGKSNESAWVADRDRLWCGGEFVWTGFDYIGEPTPYSTKNSYFGAVDTAGLPKGSYYFYKAVWNKTAEPFVKIIPHWDWNEGQIIDVIIYSNMETVELFLNGESLGSQSVDFLNNENLHCHWKVKYVKGELIAKAYGVNGKVAAVDRAASFGDTSELRTSCEVYGNLTFVTISAHDKNGEFVANARDRVKVSTAGRGRLVGLDNGDSTDYDSYKSDSRRLFSGKLVAIVKDADSANPVKVELDRSDIPVRKIELTVGSQTLTAENPETALSVRIFPENATYIVVKNDYGCGETATRREASENLDWIHSNLNLTNYKDIDFKCVLDNGIETNIANVENQIIAAKGDGTFRIRAVCHNNSDYPQVVSELEMSVSGLGVITRSQDSFAVFTAGSNDRIYGDNYKIDSDGNVSGIGNNVVLEFHGMDFGEKGASRLKIRGSTMNGANSIRINHGDCEQLIEFGDSYCFNEQVFEIERLYGKSDLRFTFLPGSNFNFAWFKFEE